MTGSEADVLSGTMMGTGCKVAVFPDWMVAIATFLMVLVPASSATSRTSSAGPVLGPGKATVASISPRSRLALQALLGKPEEVHLRTPLSDFTCKVVEL